jgi:hypothetical protein
MADDPTRAELLLGLIEGVATRPGGPLTPEAIALTAKELAPPPTAREIDVLLRILLPSVEPRDRDGAWQLDASVVEELLWPRWAELARRAQTRGQALARGSGVGPFEDESLWRFEELRATADRVETRTRRLIRDVDEHLHTFEEIMVHEAGSVAIAAANKREQTDALLRAVLYKTHWGTRKLSDARRLLGADMLLLFATPVRALDLVPLDAAIKVLTALDREIDHFAAELARIIAEPGA